MLTPPSGGGGVYQALLGKFYFATLKRDTSVPWTHGGVRL